MTFFAERTPLTNHDDGHGVSIAGSPAERRTQSSDSQTPTSSELLYAEDLMVGQHWVSSFRKISGDDVASFAALTGDQTPLHDEASGSPFGKPVVHGLLGLSILAGMGTQYPSTSTLALVGIEDWEFVAPVYFDDSVQVRNEIVAITAHGRRAVKVRWLRQLINERGRVVQQGHITTLVGSRARSNNKPR